MTNLGEKLIAASYQVDRTYTDRFGNNYFELPRLFKNMVDFILTAISHTDDHLNPGYFDNECATGVRPKDIPQIAKFREYLNEALKNKNVIKNYQGIYAEYYKAYKNYISYRRDNAIIEELYKLGQILESDPDCKVLVVIDTVQSPWLDSTLENVHRKDRYITYNMYKQTFEFAKYKMEKKNGTEWVPGRPDEPDDGDLL